jgi:NADH-quinone oxidoreductase subunit L
MEGPTPVSALIHAATMVTAGVFLTMKLSLMFCLNTSASCLLVLLGSLTATFGATTGLMQIDMKRVIAFSTCSQLGYMFLSCGVSSFIGGLYHLLNHAFFKALLFLSAGNLIYNECIVLL